MNISSWLFRATLCFLPVFTALAAQPAPPNAPTNPPTAPTEPLLLLPVDKPTPTTNLKAQIYKWTGVDGKVYYGNVRPNGIAQVEMIAIEPSPPPSASNSMKLTAQLRAATNSLEAIHQLQQPSSGSGGSSSGSDGSSGNSAPYKDPLDRAREEREASREQERLRREHEQEREREREYREQRERERERKQDYAAKPAPPPSPPPSAPTRPDPMPFKPQAVGASPYR